jgi:fluoride exporter
LTWWVWSLVGVVGAVGAPLRYVVDVLVSERSAGAFPLGTMVVNISGAFVLGLITGLAMYHGLPRSSRVIVGTGLVGAYTTFSTFSLETMQLLEEGELQQALTNVGGSLVAGGLAAAAGLALAGL